MIKSPPRRVVINISGEIYETLERTLKRYPQTLLGDLDKREGFYCSKSHEYFFNRNRLCFNAILYFYQSYGILSCPADISMEIFQHECEFFQLPDKSIINMKNKLGLIFEETEDIDISETSNNKTGKIWDFLENPETSKSARFFAILSLLMVLISVVTTCLETIPSLYVDNVSLIDNPWALTEFILNIWFFIELILRFLTCPNKFKFLKHTMNWFDIFAVIPYFLVLCISPNDMRSLGFLRILKIMRVIRLYRLSKHSKRLQVVGNIIKSSIGDLQLLLLCLAMLMIFGGSLMYFFEGYGRETQFSSIPESLWWGVQTITTVGYGDIYPATFPGKLFAACFMAFGALTMSLPVLSIVTKFMIMYSKNISD